MQIDLQLPYNLKTIQLEDATEIFRLIQSNAEYLKQWLPFIHHTHQVDDTLAFIKSVITHSNYPMQPTFTIRQHNTIIGLIGFKDTDIGNKKSEIGYWIAEDFQNKGIVTAAVIQLCQYAFNTLELNRIQLKIAVGNIPSKKIAERLHFKSEGIERAGELIAENTYRDLEIFSLLQQEFDVAAMQAPKFS